MASVKIVLRKKQNKDGTYPLAIRITKDRKSSYIHTGHHINESMWDAKNRRVKKSHPNSQRMNNLLTAKLAEAEDSLLELETQKKDTSSRVVKSKIKTKKASSFFAQADIYLADLKKQGKYNRHKCDGTRVAAFKLFLDGTDIPFHEITVTLLTKYRSYLKAKRLSEQTIVNYLTIIQTLFNLAIKNGVVDSRYYPFGRDKIVLKAPRSLKIGLSPEEVKIIEGLELPENSALSHARNLWLVSFYFAGMRASDVFRLKWTDFQNDRLYYAMGKNAKTGSLKVPEKALAILHQYGDMKHAHNLVFPDLAVLPDMTDTYVVQQAISYMTQKADKSLKDIAAKAGITKKLTMHIARHTFGNISGDKIPIQMLQKLYRHTSITTTIGYQANFIHKDADEALDAVITF